MFSDNLNDYYQAGVKTALATTTAKQLATRIGVPALLGAATGGIVGGEGNRWNTAAKGALIGGGIGAGSALGDELLYKLRMRNVKPLKTNLLTAGKTQALESPSMLSRVGETIRNNARPRNITGGVIGGGLGGLGAYGISE